MLRTRCNSRFPTDGDPCALVDCVRHQLRSIVAILVHELVQLAPMAAAERLLRVADRDDRVDVRTASTSMTALNGSWM